jgi:hypothetical protein
MSGQWWFACVRVVEAVSEPKAGEILAAIRKAYPKTAVVREVSMDDPTQMAILRRWQIEKYGLSEASFLELGDEVVDSIPADWTYWSEPLTRRIDALMKDTNGYTAIEIKVSRADFKRDTEEKRRAWRDHTRRFVYATPKGLVSPDEVADGCGLWEYEDGVLTVAKRAKTNKAPRPLPRQVLDTMLYRVSNYERTAA